MTERAERQFCIKFCIKLEHYLTETIQMFQKATAMDNWWLATSSQQCACLCITSHAEIFVKHQITQVTLPPYILDLVPCDFWLFPKLKSLKGKRFQTVDEIQENMMGQLMATGRTVCGSKLPTLKGTEGHCPVYNVSCTLFLVSVNVSIFHIIWLDTCWTDLIYWLFLFI